MGGGFARQNFGGGGFSPGFARPSFGGGFARRGFGGGGLITGRSVGFGRSAVFGPRFGRFNYRFGRRGFGIGLGLAGLGLGYGLASYGYDYPYAYDDDYGYGGDCYLRRSWYGGYPHLVQVCY
jgi:hypothetical protein